MCCQLVECLEQLASREDELRNQTGLVEHLEETMVAVQQQLAAVYYDFGYCPFAPVDKL